MEKSSHRFREQQNGLRRHYGMAAARDKPVHRCSLAVAAPTLTTAARNAAGGAAKHDRDGVPDRRFEIFHKLCHLVAMPANGDSGMKTLICVAALLTAMATTGAAADRRIAPQYSPAVAQFSYSWAAMPLLPRQLQNHCGYYDGHFICADHCGTEYQVYYCPNTASGCCHVGRGYCDGGGRLRCSPALF